MSDRSRQPALRAQGVALLLAYAGQILPPKQRADGAWLGGVRCEGYRDVYCRAVGYPTAADAARVEREAMKVLVDADLVVEQLPNDQPGFIARRKEA